MLHFPLSHYMTSTQILHRMIKKSQDDLMVRPSCLGFHAFLLEFFFPLRCVSIVRLAYFPWNSTKGEEKNYKKFTKVAWSREALTGLASLPTLHAGLRVHSRRTDWPCSLIRGFDKDASPLMDQF